MQFLIYGAKGWIGQKIVSQLNNMGHSVIEGKSRVNDIRTLEIEIYNLKPDRIISVIGRTHGTYEGEYIGTIDYLEKPEKLIENVRDNLYGPIVLAILAKKYDIHFTYLGTGCIFQFDDDHPFGIEENGFTENSQPNFFGSSYSIVKGFTDQLMHLYEENVLNARIRMPITSEFNKRNFITKITSYQKVCSIPNSMTVLDELIPILIDMSITKMSGTINLTNPGLISHNEILEMYKEIVDHDFEWQNFSVEEQNEILASKRSNNFLDTTTLEELYPNVKNIKESVRDVLINMSKNVK